MEFKNLTCLKKDQNQLNKPIWVLIIKWKMTEENSFVFMENIEKPAI